MRVTKCLSLRHRILKFGCLAFFVATFHLRLQGDGGRENEFVSAFRSCKDYEHRVGEYSGERRTLPRQLTGILSVVDHVFILSLDGCNTKVPRVLVNRSSCIIGRVVDSCSPPKYIRGIYTHAMKVTITHAFILQLSYESSYRHVAVLEDDLVFLPRQYPTEIVPDFARLIHSNSWNIIRLGFRPYFLEKNAVDPCPTNCRCNLRRKYGENLCELRRTGCDIRSSDLYILHEKKIRKLQAQLLNLRTPNSKRIIDTYPMRSLGKQWLLLPQISYQSVLDIPSEYQVGAGALYIKKCAGPRPLHTSISEQLVDGVF